MASSPFHLLSPFPFSSFSLVLVRVFYILVILLVVSDLRMAFLFLVIGSGVVYNWLVLGRVPSSLQRNWEFGWLDGLDWFG